MPGTDLYKIEDGKLVRTHPTCPKCGPSVFMANHYDRFACGKCGFTQFKQKDGSTRRTTARRVVKRSPRKSRAKLQK